MVLRACAALAETARAAGLPAGLPEERYRAAAAPPPARSWRAERKFTAISMFWEIRKRSLRFTLPTFFAMPAKKRFSVRTAKRSGSS